jgi:hypothetical protein
VRSVLYQGGSGGNPPPRLVVYNPDSRSFLGGGANNLGVGGTGAAVVAVLAVARGTALAVLSGLERRVADLLAITGLHH